LQNCHELSNKGLLYRFALKIYLNTTPNQESLHTDFICECWFLYFNRTAMMALLKTMAITSLK